MAQSQTCNYNVMNVYDSFFIHAGVISEAPSISEILLNILYFLLSLIGIIAILALVIAGVRYLFVQNTESATGVKKTLGAIIIGLFAVFLSFIVIRTVARFLT